MTRPSTPTDVLRSQVDHPAGRRESVTIPLPAPYRGPHGDDHTVGHIDPDRDAAPGEICSDASLILSVLAAIILGALAASIGYQFAGIPGAILGTVGAAVAIILFVRSI